MKPAPVHCPNCKSTRIKQFNTCRPIACACLDCYCTWQPDVTELNKKISKGDTRIAALVSVLFIIFMVGSLITANTYFGEHFSHRDDKQLSETKQSNDPDSISNYGL
jgi:uncharacterized membrane protein YciS (DUF1049 family)